MGPHISCQEPTTGSELQCPANSKIQQYIRMRPGEVCPRPSDSPFVVRAEVCQNCANVFFTKSSAKGAKAYLARRAQCIARRYSPRRSAVRRGQCRNGNNFGCGKAANTLPNAVSPARVQRKYSAEDFLPIWRCVLQAPELWGGGFETKADFGSAAMLLT